MLYVSETWATTKKDEDIIRKCDRRMMIYMARVKWQDRVLSEEVTNRCGFGDILERTRQGRLQWFGHVRRENTVSTEIHEKEGSKGVAGNGSKS